MIRLINIELIKILKKTSIKILIVLLFIVCFFTIYFSNKKDDYSIKDYELIESNESLATSYNNKIEEYVKIYNYYKDNNIKMDLKTKGIINTGVSVIVFLSIAVILISSVCLSDDINKKSIKELLTKPFKRWKILTAKIISIFIIIFLLSMYIYISYIFLTSLITGSNIFLIKDLVIHNGKIITSYYYLTFLKEVLINSIPLYFISILTILFTIIINNPKIVSALIIFLVLMSTLIFQFLLSIDFTFIEYTFFPYLDLSIYKDIYNICLINLSYKINLNLNTGIFILLIYSVLFYFLSILILNKKDFI